MKAVLAGVAVLLLATACLDEGGVATVTVGKEIPHPNTIEHHIAYLELFGEKEDGQVIALGRADFAPAYTAPTATFKIEGAFKALHAQSYCNLHGIWAGSVQL